MPREAFLHTLRRNAQAFGVEFAENGISQLGDYFELVQEHNPLLHLVAPCTPEEFAIRHVLESLTLLEFLPLSASLADVGPGAGLPSIPCLITSPHLKGQLIESKEKKARFLTTAIVELGLDDRAEVENRQFEEVPSGCDFRFVTCRALDRFAEKLPRLVRWSRGREMLLFGGPGLREALEKQKLSFTAKLMPLSEQRYLFRVPPRLSRTAVI
jgi:16S rRNA (guanine527-N7)-methyltransferase